jgi:hypothetical protein
MPESGEMHPSFHGERSEAWPVKDAKDAKEHQRRPIHPRDLRTPENFRVFRVFRGHLLLSQATMTVYTPTHFCQAEMVWVVF